VKGYVVKPMDMASAHSLLALVQSLGDGDGDGVG